MLPFTDAVLGDLHGQRAFDLVALHAYRFPPTLAPDDAGWTHYPTSPVWRQDTWTQQLEAYEQEFTAHGYGTPRMWLTEFGWPGQRDSRAGDYYPSLAAQATDVAQAYQALESPALSFVQAAFWFNQRDYAARRRQPRPGVLRPLRAALQRLRAQARGGRLRAPRRTRPDEGGVGDRARVTRAGSRLPGLSSRPRHSCSRQRDIQLGMRRSGENV